MMGWQAGGRLFRLLAGGLWLLEVYWCPLRVVCFPGAAALCCWVPWFQQSPFWFACEPPLCRVNNYGSRIDLVLTAGLSVGTPPPPAVGQPPAGAASCNGDGGSSSGVSNGSQAVPTAAAVAVWVAGGDIWPEQQGSDHCPVWADFACCSPGAAFPCASTGACCCLSAAAPGCCSCHQQATPHCCAYLCCACCRRSPAHGHASQVWRDAAQAARLPAARQQQWLPIH